MKFVSKDKWPEWIKKRLHKRKNIEVKESKGNYYLYEYKNIWDKKTQQPRKKVKYLGALKEKSCGRIYEHGHVAFVMHLISKNKILEKLKKYFPNDWEEILTFSINRVINPSPLKRIGSWADKTTLVKKLDIDNLSGKVLSKTLERIGTNIKSQTEFMKELVQDGEMLLYDGSVIYSTSDYNKLLEVGYNKEKLFLPKANITLLFSKDRNIPIHFRLFFGSVHEIKTIKGIIEEIGGKKIIFIADKGYYKNKLYDELDEEDIGFILPLPRDDKRIDYNKKLEGVFEYRKRIIRHGSYKVGPYYIYQYEDQHLKYTETTEYYRIKISGKNLEFNEPWAGKISLISNLKLKEKDAYLMWKTRDTIEKAFNVFQNLLETDHPYVSNQDVFRGYLFSSFISLIIYYLVLNVLKKQDVNDKVSVEDVLFEFSKIMIEDRNFPVFAEIPSKVEKLAKKLKVNNIVTKFWES